MRNYPNSLILPFKDKFGTQQITAHRKSTNAPQCVVADIAWAAYAAGITIPGGTLVFNAGVALDLSAASVAGALDIIKGVFIDNTGVDRPVAVQCGDTGHQVICADNSAGWFPLMTSGTAFTVLTDNIIPLKNGLQRTRLIFSNAAFDSGVAPEYNRAQQLVRASGSSQFVTPVIGDKLSVLSQTVVAGASPNSVLIPGAANSQNVLVGLKITAMCTQTTAGQSANGSVSLDVGGANIVLVNYYCFPNQPVSAILDAQTLQLVTSGNSDLTCTIINTGNGQGLITATLNYAKIQIPAI